MPQNQQKDSKSGTLVSQVADKLRIAILNGTFTPGDKLPSEAQLTTNYGVSRTVVREAVAALRSDGLVEPRQGAGVFVLPPPEPEAAPFQDVDPERLSSVVEMLELRTAVEVEAAMLAAIRHSPQQDEQMIRAQNRLMQLSAAGEPTAEADFALHLAIAHASNNPRFVEFLTMIGNVVIPRVALQTKPSSLSPEYMAQLHSEHWKIIDAISQRDAIGAREAMRAHLQGSQSRYRAMLRELKS